MELHGAHLTYCTNIHPGESWPEVRDVVARHVVEVKRALAPQRPFGVGLRLSAAAAAELAVPATLATFKETLQAQGLYVFTLNGFPYGAFHGTRVKEAVYRPDWLEEARSDYADQLAAILAALLPDGVQGSISTVPGCFRARGTIATAGAEVGRRVGRHAATLWRLQKETGRALAVALEPEPACAMETTADAISFFEQHVFRGDGVDAFARETGLARGESEAALRRHAGVCLDACHAAVEFEHPAAAVRALEAAGLQIHKLQVSAGLCVADGSREVLAALAAFDDGVYLHQVVVRRGDELMRFDDLSVAQAASLSGEWRVHFHVPLFCRELPPFESTQPFLRELLGVWRERPFTSHLEVETYTWSVLPEEHRRLPLTSSIVRELQWVIDTLGGGS